MKAAVRAGRPTIRRLAFAELQLPRACRSGGATWAPTQQEREKFARIVRMSKNKAVNFTLRSLSGPPGRRSEFREAILATSQDSKVATKCRRRRDDQAETTTQGRRIGSSAA